jgi:serine/threonine-protein kinase
MAHVFVADDTVLGRRVVVKVLRPELVEGLSAERFKREIRLAARLQHPHIVPLLAAGEVGDRADGLLYFSMPLVEGESLRTRLAREGALPFSDVLRILRDVASALAYAHRNAIVHRDIKPENILLAEGGAVVTDFGIAKAIDAARTIDGERPLDSTLTQRGTTLGTPAYMAPEQAAGDAVDHRADLYALGVVAYEMLVGRPPFDGRNAQQLLAAHATEAPEPLERRRATVPPSLAALVMQLLEKHPADRPQSTEEVLRAVELVTSDGRATRAAPRSERIYSRVSKRALSRGAGLVVAGVLAGTVLGWLAGRGARDGPGERVSARFTLDLPSAAYLNTDGPGNSMVFSPDGSRLAYIGGQRARILVRHLDSLIPRTLSGTDQATNPQYSPDGQWIGYLGRTGLKRVPASGGPVADLAPTLGRFAWTPDGGVIYTRNVGGFLRGLWYLSPDRRSTEEITSADSSLGATYGSPLMFPDGRTVVFTAADRDGNLTLAAVRLGNRAVTPLGIVGSGATYVDDGHLAFSRADGSIAAVRFDARALRVLSEPVKVLDSVAIKSGGVAQLVVAPNGTMAYLPGVIGTQLVRTDRRGIEEVLLPAIQNFSNPRLSPDGRRIAVSIGHPPYISDVWIFDIASRTLTRLTTGGTSDAPDWTPDGRRIAWTSVAPGKDGIWWQPWDASEPPALLVPGARAPRFTPDGEGVLASVEKPDGLEVRLLSLRAPGAPGRLILPASRSDRQYRVSPDGRWMAYASDETGAREVFAKPLRGPGGQYQISAGGGAAPAWTSSGREILYILSGCCTISATVIAGNELTVARRDTLFAVRGESHPVLQSRSAYDVTADGRHFVMARLVADVGQPIVVFNWADDVRTRVAAAQR